MWRFIWSRCSVQCSDDTDIMWTNNNFYNFYNFYLWTLYILHDYIYISNVVLSKSKYPTFYVYRQSSTIAIDTWLRGKTDQVPCLCHIMAQVLYCRWVQGRLSVTKYTQSSRKWFQWTNCSLDFNDSLSHKTAQAPFSLPPLPPPCPLSSWAFSNHLVKAKNWAAAPNGNGTFCQLNF